MGQHGNRRLIRNLVPPLAAFVLFLLGWLLVSQVVLTPDRRFLLPPPQAVVRVGLLDAANLSTALRALRSTTAVAVVGLGLAAAVGPALAIVMSRARCVERSLYPYVVALQTIPILALVPLIGLWFGFDFASRVLVCALIAVFPLITNTLFGLRSATDGLHDLFTLSSATRLARLWKLELPSALPAIFTGLRISAGLSVVGAIVGDFFFRQGEPGIGRLIDLYRARLESEQMLTAVFLASLLGLAIFWTSGLLTRLAVGRWHDPERRRP